MKQIKQLISFAILASASVAASAAAVRVAFDDNIFAAGYDAVAIRYGKSTSAVDAGMFSGQLSKLDGVASSLFVHGTSDFYAYCYDLDESVWGGRKVDYTLNLEGGTARTLDFLGAVNSVLNARYGTQDPYAWLNPRNGSMAAAIQVGIWESLYDTTGWNWSAGQFGVLYGAARKTVGWLDTFIGALGVSDALDGKYVMTLVARGAQDLITGSVPPSPPVELPQQVPTPPVAPPAPTTPTTPVEPPATPTEPVATLPVEMPAELPVPPAQQPSADVPEPASLALVGLALVGLVSVRRRKV